MIRTRTDKASDDLGTSVISVFSQTHNSEFLGGKNKGNFSSTRNSYSESFLKKQLRINLYIYTIYIYIYTELIYFCKAA